MHRISNFAFKYSDGSHCSLAVLEGYMVLCQCLTCFSVSNFRLLLKPEALFGALFVLPYLQVALLLMLLVLELHRWQRGWLGRRCSGEPLV